MNKSSLIKKGLAVVVILLFIGMSVISSTGTVIEKKFSIPINYDGNTLYVGGNGPGNYSKIQDAINDSSDGDTVFVYDDSSPYYENVVINKSISLIGEDKDTTIVDGRKISNVVYITSPGVVISGFTTRNSADGTYPAGISVERECDGSIIYKNRVLDCLNGIVSFSNNVTIKDNEILPYIGYSGIGLYGNLEYPVYKNIIDSNTIIVDRLTSYPISIFDGFENMLINNTISGGWKYHSCLLINRGGRNFIADNFISSSFKGIYLTGSCENIFIRNQIVDNTEYGILLNRSSDNNILYHNDFINNAYNCIDYCDNIWDDGYPSGGNYWDDYNGIDNDGDGIGDTPYNIPGGDNQDRYPLMKPYGQAGLEITKVKGGIFSFTIKNVDDETAINVSWSIHFKGGIVFPREQHSFNNYNLAPDEERTIVLWPSSIPEERHLVLGIGRVTITMVANADNTPIVSKSIPGFLFLFFIKIKPGS